MKYNKQLLIITHLSQLVTLFIGFGSLILPLIIWYSQKDKIYQLEEQGKGVINFQLSLVVFYAICIPLILLFGLGLLGWSVLGVVSIVYPIINAIKVNNGEVPKYAFSFKFIS